MWWTLGTQPLPLPTPTTLPKPIHSRFFLVQHQNTFINLSACRSSMNPTARSGKFTYTYLWI
jgi:hypothetical protein